MVSGLNDAGENVQILGASKLERKGGKKWKAALGMGNMAQEFDGADEYVWALLPFHCCCARMFVGSNALSLMQHELFRLKHYYVRSDFYKKGYYVRSDTLLIAMALSSYFTYK